MRVWILSVPLGHFKDYKVTMESTLLIHMVCRLELRFNAQEISLRGSFRSILFQELAVGVIDTSGDAHVDAQKV